MIHLFFMTLPYAVWGLLMLCFVRPLSLGRWKSAGLGIVFLVMLQKFVLHRWAGGDAFSPDLPSFVVNGAGWLYAIAMFVCLQSVAGCVLLGTCRICGRQVAVRTRRRAGCVIVAVAFALSTWGMWEGMRVPPVRRIEIPIRGLPAGFDGFRIVQLSDLHCSSSARAGRTRAIVERTNALHPDLVCITGDIVDGKPERRLEDVAPLAGLRARHGTVACLGNHEYYHDYAAWTKIYRSLGIDLLENRHVTISRGASSIAVGGITDDTARSPHHAGTSAFPDLAETFRGAPEGAPRILMQHQPYLPGVDHRRHRVALQLSGHTHGGAILGLDLLVKRLNNGFLRGIYDEGDLIRYVSPGTGQWAGFPLRLGAFAEITEIILRPRRQQ